ncbi:MAG: rhomboid family intramembrane serine protease [Cyanobacteriota bacterium]|nr:rhomboid family intramembrane serine protease [Cyanobacteriota bacterium]
MANSHVLLHSPLLPEMAIALDLLLLGMVCLSCLSIFIRATMSPYHRGWSVVSGGILAIALFLAWGFPHLAPWVAGGLWVTFIVWPLMGLARVNKLTHQQCYSRARRLAEGLRWLHPADGWLDRPRVLLALELGQHGQVEEAIALLQEYASEPTPFGRNAAALQYAMEARWPELRRWVERRVPRKALAREPNLLGYYLRSLGEMGDLNALLKEGERYESILEQGGNAIALTWSRMLIFAFGGQRELVVLLFEKSLPLCPPHVRDFWVLTALMAGGMENSTREQLLALSASDDAPFNTAIAWRLSHPLAKRDRVLTPASRQILARLSKEYQQERSYARALTLTPTRAYTTYSLIALNLLFFAAASYGGGSEDRETLYRLGALVPLEIQQGQWWRLISANFLHFGWLHLTTNMLGLYLLGPFVELHLGFQRYLTIYFISGVGSMFGFAWIALQGGGMEQGLQLLVGASAAVMGLIGATAAILIYGSWIEKSRIATRRLRFVVLIIVVQVIFDFSVPQVSFLAHALGFLLGLLTGFLLVFSRR